MVWCFMPCLQLLQQLHTILYGSAQWQSMLHTWKCTHNQAPIHTNKMLVFLQQQVCASPSCFFSGAELRAELELERGRADALIAALSAARSERAAALARAQAAERELSAREPRPRGPEGDPGAQATAADRVPGTGSAAAGTGVADAAAGDAVGGSANASGAAGMPADAAQALDRLQRQVRHCAVWLRRTGSMHTALMVLISCLTPRL